MTPLRWIIAAVLTTAVGFVAVTSARPRTAPPESVRAAPVETRDVTRRVTAAGKVEPVEKVSVSSNITGTLLDLAVDVGAEVERGDYLGQIDTSRSEARVRQARAELDAARAELARARERRDHLRRESDRTGELAERGLASESQREGSRSQAATASTDVTAARQRVQVARARLDEEEKRLEWATLSAPIAGTILAVKHRPGERVLGSDLAEDVVLVLGSLTEVQVRMEVGEFDIVHIEPDQPARIEIDSMPGRELRGHVIRRGRDAIVRHEGTEREVTRFPVWVAVERPPPGLLSGMSAQVTIATETREDAVAVPIQAVTVRELDARAQDSTGPLAAREPRSRKVVFVIEDGVARERTVEPGIASETHVAIEDGLEEGERVVEGPYRTLARGLEDGDRVAVEEDAP